MYCKSLSECFEQISAYADREGTGYPLIVDAENYNDFQEILHRLNADGSKQCIYVSEHTFGNGLPDIQEVKNQIRGNGCYVLAGISQSMMLRGEAELDKILDELLGFSIKGHAIVLVSHCRIYLEKYRQRDIRLDNRIAFIENKKSPLPQIRLAANKDVCTGIVYDDGIKALLAHLERITDSEIARTPSLTVVTSFSPTLFRSSMYAVLESAGIYDAICDQYPDLACATVKDYGTDTQWTWLQKTMKKHNSFSSYIVSRFGSTTDVSSHLGEILENGSANDKWLIWLALKVFGVASNRYLSLVLSNSVNSSDLEDHIYKDLLDVDYKDHLFNQYFSERKQLLSKLPEDLPQVSSYCQLVGRHGKNAVYYLTDATENEEFTFMQVIDEYEWTDEELLSAIRHGFPELALYMREFVFDSFNTRLPEKDKDFRTVLTGYFKRYKTQKILNRINDDFLAEVNEFAVERPFYKLQPRSSILSTMDRKGTQGFFFDALGVEYLPYIQAKCEQYGLCYEIDIAHCELPSITVKNKDFKHYFDTKDIGDLDELKHHSQIYDYQTCPYPIHVFRELEIIDKEIRHIRAQLIQQVAQKAVIISDHGASRLAVIYQHVNDSLIELDEKGEHSGRCCPAPEDPHIPAAAYEDGYAVLGNYERFKGSRKANLEVHGGASLEEVVVPIITLQLKPDNVVYYFVDPVIKHKIGQVPEIVLFSNVPMKQSKLLVDGNAYESSFQKDKNHAVFAFEHIKRVGTYKATVYEGNQNTGIELEFRVEKNTKDKGLFGLMSNGGNR